MQQPISCKTAVLRFLGFNLVNNGYSGEIRLIVSDVIKAANMQAPMVETSGERNATWQLFIHLNNAQTSISHKRNPL
ncbi:MAG: hypothetical protein QNI92_07685 [Desulfobacterales bacterium]|nr:hypothetical protein [Desulfobacterales bacterium]